MHTFVNSPQVGDIVTPSMFCNYAVPDREWFVDGIIPHKTVTLISGDGGLGKSLLMQQLITAAALGQDWLGLKIRKCRTFGLFCEDSNDELLRRQQKICKSYDVGLEACYNMSWLSGVGIDPVLMEFSRGDRGCITRFFIEMNEFLDQWHPQLIIIDTAADTFAGDEVKRSQVRNYINNALGAMANKYNATVILTSHPSRAGMSDGSGISGSTAWNNSVRSRLYLTRSGKDLTGNARVLQMMKSNYGSSQREVNLLWEDGVFKTIDLGFVEDEDVVCLREERCYLKALKQLHDRGQKAHIHKNQASYGPKLLYKLSEAGGLSRAKLEAAQERLFDKGIIANIEEKDGPPSKRKMHIQVKSIKAAEEIIS
ncbi:MAG: AAA family ATPase [Alphaproteobacteria bacterium]|nr:AAA family ATPase [Alphaproteobacteria bacterium]